MTRESNDSNNILIVLASVKSAGSVETQFGLMMTISDSNHGSTNNWRKSIESLTFAMVVEPNS
jgi:hypothetical protein